MKNTDKNWFRKHWIIITLLGFIALGMIITIFNNLTNNNPNVQVTGDIISEQDIQMQEELCDSNWQCSSWSECNPSEIQTRVCNDINDCGVNTNKPKESQSCVYEKPETWNEVISFSGNGNQDTESFYIETKKVRITATTCCGFANEYGSVGTYSSINLKSEEGRYLGTGLSIMTEGTEEGHGQTIYRNLDEGEYYISIITGVNWEINIEEYS
jgi:hypothetical protein